MIDLILKVSMVDVWRRKWQPTPVFLPRESRIQKSLVGCCPWGHTGSNTTEGLSMHACIGEGNGNPLQCSCLENSRDGGAWWAAIYGVAQSRTRLKRPSSSSSSSSMVDVNKIFFQGFFLWSHQSTTADLMTLVDQQGYKDQARTALWTPFKPLILRTSNLKNYLWPLVRILQVLKGFSQAGQLFFFSKNQKTTLSLSLRVLTLHAMGGLSSALPQGPLQTFWSVPEASPRTPL